MSTFKIGDRVTIIQIKNGAPRETVGLTGTIVSGKPNNWAVKFVNKYCGYDLWEYSEREFNLSYSPPPMNQTYQFKVGDRVRVKGSTYLPQALGFTGTVTKVEELNSTDAYACVTLDDSLPNGLMDSNVSFYFRDLELLSGTPVPEEPYITTPATTQTKGDLMVFRVTAILTPSVNAQQNGAVESVIIDDQSVVANDANAASLVAGAKNADAITKAAGGTIRTRVEGPF